MGNKWIDHVRKYAKEHNLTYACALSQPDIKNNYEKVIKKSLKEKNDEKKKIIEMQLIKVLKNKIKNMSDNDKPLIRMKYYSYSKGIKEGLKEKYPNYYEKLMSK